MSGKSYTGYGIAGKTTNRHRESVCGVPSVRRARIFRFILVKVSTIIENIFNSWVEIIIIICYNLG